GRDGDARLRQQRKDAGVSAILHEAAPVRYWDHDLGPDQPRLLAAMAADGGLAAPPRDLTPRPGRALDEQHAELAPDGSLAVTGWAVPDGAGDIRVEIAVIDTATGAPRTLLAAPAPRLPRPHDPPGGAPGRRPRQAPGRLRPAGGRAPGCRASAGGRPPHPARGARRAAGGGRGGPRFGGVLLHRR